MDANKLVGGMDIWLSRWSGQIGVQYWAVAIENELG